MKNNGLVLRLLEEKFNVIPREINATNNTFGSAIYQLFKNGHFENYHLPSKSYTISCDDGFYLLKIFPKEYSERANTLANVLDYLNTQGIACPKPVGSVCEDNHIENHLLLLLKSKKGNFLDNEEVEQCFKKPVLDNFVRLYSQLGKCLYKTIEYPEIINFSCAKSTIGSIRKTIDQKHKNQFDVKVVAHLNRLERMIDKKEILDTNEFSWGKKQLIHGDYTFHNIAWNKNFTHIKEITDFDMLQVGSMALEASLSAEHLFGYSTKNYFEFIENTKRRLYVPHEDMLQIPEAHLTHKALNLIVLKLAYLTNNKMYSSLQGYLNKEMSLVQNIVKNRDQLKEKISNLK